MRDNDDEFELIEFFGLRAELVGKEMDDALLANLKQSYKVRLVYNGDCYTVERNRTDRLTVRINDHGVITGIQFG